MSLKLPDAIAAVTRLLLLLYPASFRRELGPALVADVRRRAADLAAAKGSLRLALWAPRLVGSLLANALAIRGERPHGHPRTSSMGWVRFSWLDVKLGLRMLVRTPGLSLAGGMAIAVAIAIGAGFFGFMWAYFYPSIPLSEGDRLVGLENWDLEINNEERRSLHDFVLWRDEMRSVEDMAAYRTTSRNLVLADGTAELVRIAEMTPSGFALARVPPFLGRTLVEADALPDAPPALVIGYDIWRTRFTADVGIVGTSVRLGHTVHTIVGVMPESFAFPVNHDFWVPLEFDLTEIPVGGGPPVFIAGRLAPEATLADAQAELTVLGTRMAETNPATHARFRAQVMPYVYPVMDVNQQGGKSFLPQLTAMGGLLALLLTVMCVNVAILVYARTATRLGEIAVRTALGAPRGRIVAQLFTEALVLSSVAAAVGLLIAKGGMRIGQRIMETEVGEMPFWMDLDIPTPALVFVVLLTALAAVITGVIPGLQATGRHVQASLSEFHSGSGMRLGRTWTALVVFQVGFAVLALPIAFATGWWEVRGATTVPTFPVEHFALVSIAPDPEPPAGVDAQRWAASRVEEVVRRSEELGRRLEAEPGIVGRTYTGSLPGRGSLVRVGVADDPSGVGGGTGYEAEVTSVEPDHFGFVGCAILTGRTFTHAEREAGAADVVVVNRTFVRRVLGGGEALGRKIRFLPEEAESGEAVPARWHEIVGVVDDLRRNPIDPDLVRPLVYRPLPAVATEAAPMLLLRLSDLDPAALGARVRSLAAELDPTLRVVAYPVALAFEQARLALRLTAVVLALILVAVLLMSAAGIYALMSFTVTQRRREIAVRTALGAQPRVLLRGIFRRAAAQVGVGVAFGVTGAIALERLSGGDVLHGLGPALLPAMVTIMATVGLMAAWGPARRGLRLQPSEVLKGD